MTEPELTEDVLVEAILDFRDAEHGYPLKVSKIVCGERASVNAKRILAVPGEAEGVPSFAVEVDPRMQPDDWRLA